MGPMGGLRLACGSAHFSGLPVLQGSGTEPAGALVRQVHHSLVLSGAVSCLLGPQGAVRNGGLGVRQEL